MANNLGVFSYNMILQPNQPDQTAQGDQRLPSNGASHPIEQRACRVCRSSSRDNSAAGRGGARGGRRRLHEHVNLARRVRRHPQTTCRVPGQSDRAEALARTDGQVAVGHNVRQRRRAVGSRYGLASRRVESNRGKAVANRVGRVD
jgi:hypothetical protein